MTMLPISDRRYRHFFILSAQFDNKKSSRSMTDLTESLTPSPPPPPSKQAPFREDCWTEDATWTLVDAWGRRYLDLNRGNLRQKDWQEVANAVNALHGHTKKTRRSDVQCKNRIDTLKKKYKVEKMRISECNGVLTSNWPFFSRFEHLIGSKFSENSSKLSPSPNLALPSPPPPPIALPLAHRKLNLIGSNVFTPPIVPQKRSMPSPPENDVSHFRRNYSAMAAAAAAAAEDENDGESGGDDDKEVDEGEEGMSRLARAIESFGEIYERVESMKQRQMVELEKQRMQFAKDLEVQRMQLFMDTQLQLEKIKRAKRGGSSDDIYS